MLALPMFNWLKSSGLVDTFPSVGERTHCEEWSHNLSHTVPCMWFKLSVFKLWMLKLPFTSEEFDTFFFSVSLTSFGLTSMVGVDCRLGSVSNRLGDELVRKSNRCERSHPLAGIFNCVREGKGTEEQPALISVCFLILCELWPAALSSCCVLVSAVDWAVPAFNCKLK